MDEFGKVGAEMHSDNDSAESVADSDLENENYEKCWLHHGICKIEKPSNPLECQLHLRKLRHWDRREKQVQSVLKLTSEKVWCQVRLRSRLDPWNLLHCLIEKRRTRKPIQEFCFQRRWSIKIWEDPFFKGTQITCSIRQDLKLWSKDTKLNLSILVGSCSKKRVFKDWNYRTHNTDFFWISTRTSSSTWRIIFEGKCSLRYSNPKYARNREKLRERKNFDQMRSQCKS